VRNDSPKVLGLLMLLTTQFGETVDGLITKDVSVLHTVLVLVL